MVEEQSLSDRGVKDVGKLWNNMEWFVLRRYNLKETKTTIYALFLYFSFPEFRWRKEFGMVKDPHWILLMEKPSNLFIMPLDANFLLNVSATV